MLVAGGLRPSYGNSLALIPLRADAGDWLSLEAETVDSGPERLGGKGLVLAPENHHVAARPTPAPSAKISSMRTVRYTERRFIRCGCS
ncbi:hypothetical protein TSA66_09275 [Noviherbaspirillum autotrophicum]|uniref:Uncharacterized protein n=1 Tax=Noviherbaspirillum autotrophicum TaxID=709839 RepID=A0A0C2BID6_9BURK|nr:hypothetical protein TSA66_09275 [Noviherbaspirillum autotrophicum]